MNKRDLKTLKEKTIVSSIEMNKRDLEKLTKAQLIRLLLKQQAQKPIDSVNKPIPAPRTGKWESVKPKPVPRKNVKQMVNDYEDIIQPPEQFRDGYKPIPVPRTKIRKPVPKPRKSVKQMVNEYEDIIQPPEQFRDAYKPIPKPRTGRPLQMQNARRPPKPQRPPPPPPEREPSSKIKELSRALENHERIQIH